MQFVKKKVGLKLIKIVLVGKKVARKWLWRDSWAMTRTSTWSSVAGSVRYSHAIVQLGRSGWNTICQAGKSIVFCSWLSFLFIMAALQISFFLPIGLKGNNLWTWPLLNISLCISVPTEQGKLYLRDRPPDPHPSIRETQSEPIYRGSPRLR